VILTLCPKCQVRQDDPRWQWAHLGTVAAGWVSGLARAVRRTIRPLVARASGLAGLLPCCHRWAATRHDGIYPQAELRFRRVTPAQPALAPEARRTAAGSPQPAAALLAMPPAFLQPPQQPRSRLLASPLALGGAPLQASSPGLGGGASGGDAGHAPVAGQRTPLRHARRTRASGSTDTYRLRRGCSRPPRRFPAQAAPSFATLLRQGSAVQVSHFHSNRQRLTAHVNRG
jgi:hypothetical protein